MTTRSDRLKTEDRLLDELEGSTQRIFQQSKALNDEALSQLQMLNKIDVDMADTSGGLREEALHAESARKLKTGVCWMYVVITFESILLVYLIIKGLS